MIKNPALVLLLVSMLIALAAHQTISAGEVPADSASDATLPKAEDIRALQEKITKAGDIDKASQEQALSIYTQALEQLELAAEWAARAKEFRASQAEAPEMLRQLSSELSLPAATVPDRPDPTAGLSEMEQQLLQAESSLEAANRLYQELQSEKARRAERRIELPNLLTIAKERLDRVAIEQLTIASPVDQARDVANRVRRYALAKEIDAYEQELLSYEMRGDLLEKRLELAELRIEGSQKIVAALSQSVDKKRRELTELAVKEAEQELGRVHPALRDLAAQNLELTRLRGEVSEAIKSARERAADSDEYINRLKQEFSKIEGRVAAAGLTHAIGQFLRKQHAGLPRERRLRRDIREIHVEIGAVQARIIELEDQLSYVKDVESMPDRLLGDLEVDIGEPEGRRIQRRVRELVADQQKYLEELIDDYGAYFSELVDYDVSQRRLLEETRLFARFIEEKILWIKSGKIFVPQDLLVAGDALVWLASPDGWRTSVQSAVGSVKTRPVICATLFIVIVFLLGMQRRLRRLMPVLTAHTSRKPATLVSTLKAFLLTFVLAGTVPALLWFTAWLLTASYESSEFAKAIANGLRSAAVIYLTVEIMKQLNVEGGVGAQTFKWRKGTRHQLLEILSWLRWIVIPAAFVAGAMDFQSNELFRNSLGRVAFIIPMIVLSIVAYRIARPSSSLMTQLRSTGRHKWLHPLRYIIAVAAIGIPAGLAIASFMGYHYTAYYLAWRFIETIWIFLALLLLDAFSHLWLRLRIRARALEQAASHTTEAAASTRLVMGDGIEVPIEDEAMDVATINTQTSRILNTAVIAGAVAGAWLIWSEVLPALSVLDQIKLWSTSVETAETVTRPDGSTTVNSFTVQVPVTLTDLGFSIVLLVVAFVAARNLPGLLEISLLEPLPLAPSVRYAITSLSKYTIAAIGIVIAFNAIGVSWSKVQWLVAAMTVGLAFGLQEIFANLVSGIIILFERPIRVGDVVTVGNVSGTVSRIRIRATTITDWDRRELIVPNKHFITEQILNWTLSDAIIQIIVPVSVGRGSEVVRVREILHTLASEDPMVLKEPEPSVIFKGAGPGALRFELRVFIRREDYSEVLDALNSSIEAGLKKANIDIAVDRQENQARTVSPHFSPGSREQAQDSCS